MRLPIPALLLLGLLVACSEKTEQQAPPPVTPITKPAPAPPTSPDDEGYVWISPESLAEKRAEEAVVLRPYRAVARRQGNQLLLRLTNGQEKALTDVVTPSDSIILYDFVRHYPRLGYYLVHYGLWEGDGYLLVNQRTGKQTDIAAAPLLSPDSTRLVVAARMMYPPYNLTVLQMYRLTPTGLHQEFYEEPENWGPLNTQWLDSVTVQFDKQVRLPEPILPDSFQMAGTFLLQKPPDGKWQIRPKE